MNSVQRLKIMEWIDKMCEEKKPDISNKQFPKQQLKFGCMQQVIPSED